MLIRVSHLKIVVLNKLTEGKMKAESSKRHAKNTPVSISPDFDTCEENWSGILDLSEVC